MCDKFRDGEMSDTMRCDSERAKFEKFKATCVSKYPKCSVLNEAKIRCVICEKTITLSVPSGIRNFSRHMITHQNLINDDKKTKQNYQLLKEVDTFFFWLNVTIILN